MNRLLFDKKTHRITGIDRAPRAFEGIIEGVDAQALTKQVTDTRRVPKQGTATGSGPKADAASTALYLLPQEPLEVVEDRFKDVQTTEVTDRPVKVTVTRKVPLLDADGEQVRYEVLKEQVTPAEFDTTGKTPKLLTAEVREMVPTGIFRDCYVVSEEGEEEVHKTDTDGNPLYLKAVNTPVTVQVAQEPLEITEADERFRDGLERASEDQTFSRTIRYRDEPDAFTFEDAFRYKEAHVADGTLYASGKHFEGFTEELFATHLQDAGADIGFEAFILPPGKAVRTAKLDLPQASASVHIRIEPPSALSIEAGDAADDLRPVDARNEVTFDAPADSVYVSFRNGTERPISVRAFSLLI
jgi:hypothetical protein